MKTKLVLDKKKISYPTGQLIKDLWSFLPGYKTRFFSYTIILIISNLLPFVSVFYLGQIVDFFVAYKPGNALNPFYWFVLFIGVAGTMQVYLRFVAKWELQEIASKIRMNARILAMSRLVDFELKWHEKEETGSKIQKIASGGDSINRAFGFFIDSFIPIAAGLIGGLTIFAFLQFKYVLFCLVYMVIYLSAEYILNKKVAYWQDQLNRIREKVSGKIHEGAANMLTVKTMGLKEMLRKSVADYEQQFFEVWSMNKRANQSKFKFVKIFSAVGYALFILIVGLDAVAGAVSIGSIIILINYFGRIRGPLEEITNNIGQFIEVKSGVGRIMTLLDRKMIKKEASDLIEIPADWKTVEFSNVGFKYKNEWILRNFNLEIKRGEKVGIVGRSGCGKSTLVKLLLGLYELQEGEIKINGLNLNRYKHSSLTSKISVVLQDSEMFNSSLKDNISITSDKPNEIALKKAIEFSELLPLIKKLPNGLSTLVGEKGYKVSGGERQRIGIARAIYRNNDFLVLDEATSSLDSKTEEVIQRNIDTFLSNKTMLIIAHRLSTLKNVDRVIVMDKGKIVESGNFKELLDKKGKFFDLYRIQRSRNL